MVERLINSEANARRIANVESCFGNSGQPLALPGRVLVGEGVLVKMCRRKPKQRQFFLFNDILIYGTIVLPKRKYNRQHLIPLEEIQLENLEDDGELKNGWLIKAREKSFAVYAATATEKSEWMSHIHRCLDDLLSRSGKQASQVHAAVWVPDREAPKCMHCKTTQFTMLSRRHHCRKCGMVCCGPCSSKRFLLPHQSRQPLRVCLTCYDKMTRSGGGEYNVEPAKKQDVAGDTSGEESSGEEDDSGAAHEPTRFYGDPVSQAQQQWDSSNGAA